MKVGTAAQAAQPGGVSRCPPWHPVLLSQLVGGRQAPSSPWITAGWLVPKVGGGCWASGVCGLLSRLLLGLPPPSPASSPLPPRKQRALVFSEFRALAEHDPAPASQGGMTWKRGASGCPGGPSVRTPSDWLRGPSWVLSEENRSPRSVSFSVSRVWSGKPNDTLGVSSLPSWPPVPAHLGNEASEVPPPPTPLVPGFPSLQQAPAQGPLF